jgi:asparagine synthase (glutamine-hydrolysing)
MSGISGIVRFDGTQLEPYLIEGMTESMSYRGPDGINHWSNGSVALGQCMLHTTAESLEEELPFTSRDGTLVLVMDGRVDNYEELRRKLLQRCVVLRSRSDAELVIHAYEQWGQNCLLHIDGDFSFAIWDARNRTLFCARDRIGNKPFYHHWNGKTFVFASDLHTILSLPWVASKLNMGMLAEFLSNEWISLDETFWIDVFRLVAAHTLTVGERGLYIEKYWKPDLWANLPYRQDQEYADHYKELLAKAVKSASRSHRPVAYEVSGGLDSSAVFAMADHLYRRNELHAPDLIAFTLDFHDDPGGNELEYAFSVGNHLNRQITPILPSRKPLSWYRSWAQKFRDFPNYPNGVMGLGILENAQQQGSRVLLTGSGGDDWLCGSRVYYAEMLALRDWTELWRTLQGDSHHYGLRTSLWWLTRYGLALHLPKSLKKTLRKLADDADPQDWLSPELRVALQRQREKHNSTDASAVRRVGQQTLLSNLSHPYSAHAREMQERLSSSVGMEFRHPMWDAKLVQFAFTTPTRLHLRGKTNKSLHRIAMSGVLPELVLDRHTKAEFSVCSRQHLQCMGDDLTVRIPMERSWIDQSRACAMFEQCQKFSGGSERWMLWSLFGCDAIAAAEKT